MYRYPLFALVLVALLGAASADASCVYPELPEWLPDGATATYDDMVEAHGAVRRFDKDVRTFTVCLELEVKAILEDPSIDEATRNGLRELLVARIDAAIDDAEFVVGQFNEQLRLFREREAQ